MSAQDTRNKLAILQVGMNSLYESRGSEAAHVGLGDILVEMLGDLPASGNLTDAGTDGITITNGTGAVFGSGTSIAQHIADASHNGYLSSADWSTFNSKQSALALTNLTDAGTDGITITNGTAAVIGASPVTISQHVADASHNGYLSSTDWSTFNNKQSTLTLTNLTDAGTDGITITNGTGAVVGASPVTVSQHIADASHNGYLSSADWSTFNGKQAAITGGTPGQILYANGSGNPVFQSYINLSAYVFYSDDFLTPPADLNQGTGGASASCKISASANSAAHPGAMRMGTGTTTTGYGNLYGSNVDNVIALGGGLTTFESIVNISALSNGTDTYTIQIGLTNPAYNNTLAITDGVYFTYTDSVSSGNWVLNCAAGSSITSVDTGVAVTAAWQRIGWVLNAAGTSVQAYINGIAVGTPITTNIPTASTNFQWYIQKSAGTADIHLDLDAYSLFIALNTAR